MNKYEINEINAKDINQKIEQLNYRIKERNSAHESEMLQQAQRITVVDDAIAAIREEMVDYKIMSENIKK